MLKEWIEQHVKSSLSDLRILARGLARDVDANVRKGKYRTVRNKNVFDRKTLHEI